jgi:regulator of replication initiation timing
MTKRKLTKHQDDIRRNLRKNAEINDLQSPHDGIHTCSKGCSKPGCNRGLRDTIEEQDKQIQALKQDLLEQTAAARHLRMERIHDLNHIGGLQEENARLKAEVDRLRKAGDAMAFNYESMYTAVSVYDCDLMKYVKAWNAAKDGKDADGV